jgi:predicted dehydrogenase
MGRFEMSKADGMRYAPKGVARAVCQPGEFRFGVIGLDHGHINGMCNGLLEAGAQLVSVYDPDPAKVAEFQQAYPGSVAASSEGSLLADASLHLVASAIVPSERADLGLRVMASGKDFFADKPPLTTLDQLSAARQQVAATGKRYFCYFSERLHVEAAVYAGDLIRNGAIGRVLQVIGMGPHRLGAATRPAWFFHRASYGGILCDIGSHQIEQFLYYAGTDNARVLHSKIANYAHPEYPGLEDFGDCTLVGDNGATQYFRVDWFTPAGLGSWGDGRTFILGTEGYIELRKYLDVARDPDGDQVYMVDAQGEHHFSVHGKVGYPFFGQLILDVLNRTEVAMTQAHIFKAVELAIVAEMQAVRVAGPDSSISLPVPGEEARNG